MTTLPTSLCDDHRKRVAEFEKKSVPPKWVKTHPKSTTTHKQPDQSHNAIITILPASPTLPPKAIDPSEVFTASPENLVIRDDTLVPSVRNSSALGTQRVGKSGQMAFNSAVIFDAISAFIPLAIAVGVIIVGVVRFAGAIGARGPDEELVGGGEVGEGEAGEEGGEGEKTHF